MPIRVKLIYFLFLTFDMAADIISSLDSGDFNEFKKDFFELIRVHKGIRHEYSRFTKDVDKYLKEFNGILVLFNKKYPNILLRLRKAGLELRIFVREKSVKEVFMNAASKLNGLKGVGSGDFGTVGIGEPDLVSKELDKAKNRLFISYSEHELSSSLFLEQHKKGIVELHLEEGIDKERHPGFRLCAYYAVKDGIKKIDLYERLIAIGFTDMPGLDKVRSFLKKFDPRLEE